MNKYTLITAIVISLILWTSFVIVQSNKQASIEYQKRLEIEQKQAELDYKKDQDEKLETEKANKAYDLSQCLIYAEKEYFDYAELNWNVKDDWSIWAQPSVWTKAQDRKDKADDICFKKYN